MSQFKSIAVLPGATADAADEVWVIVRRYINGQWVNLIERFRDRRFDTDTLYDAWFVDCAGWGGGYIDVVSRVEQEVIRGTEFMWPESDAVHFFDPDTNYVTQKALPGNNCRYLATTSDGLLTVASFADTVGVTPNNCIVKYDADLNPDYSFYMPNAGFASGEVGYSCFFTPDDQYLYLNTSRYLYKFDTSTGNEIWHHNPLPGHQIVIDSSSNLYYVMDSSAGAYMADSDGTFIKVVTGTDSYFGQIAGNGRWCAYDEENDRIYYGGSWYTVLNKLVPNGYYQIMAVGMDGSNPRVYSVGLTTHNSNAGIFLNGYLYVITESVGGLGLWKFDENLTLLASAATGECDGICEDGDGNIVVFKKAVAVYTYDTDLNLINTGSWPVGVSTSIRGATAVRIRYTKDVIYYDSTTYEATPGQSCQLEGEVVNILADGVKYPQQVVENCQIDTSGFTNPDTENVIWGLPVRCYQQPMGVNLTSLAFIPHKNITHIILNLFQSLDFEYGREAGKYDVIPYEYTHYDKGPALFTGTKRLPFEGNYTQFGEIILFTDGNLPFTIRAMAVVCGMEDMGEQLISTVKSVNSLGGGEPVMSGPEIPKGRKRKIELGATEPISETFTVTEPDMRPERRSPEPPPEHAPRDRDGRPVRR